jgi:cob(I)alamin adenosyltransferase
MRIYTKTGDAGETRIFGGERVWKDSPRLEAYGTVDELCSTIGLARSWTSDQQIRDILKQIQIDLFDLCADLSTPQDHPQKSEREMPHGRVEDLEQLIDTFQSELPPWTHFILPGGTACASALHLARTICRKAERRIVSFSKMEEINPEVLRYINRLSDLLFVMARVVNHRMGEAELNWQPIRSRKSE